MAFEPHGATAEFFCLVVRAGVVGPRYQNRAIGDGFSASRPGSLKAVCSQEPREGKVVPRNGLFTKPLVLAASLSCFAHNERRRMTAAVARAAFLRPGLLPLSEQR